MVAIPVSDQKLDEGGRFTHAHYVIVDMQFSTVKFYANF